MTAVAIGCAMGAVLSLLPAVPRLPGTPQPMPPHWYAGPLLGAAVMLSAVGGSAHFVFLALLVVGTGWAATSFMRHRTRRREERDTATRVLEGCELLAAELGTGRPPGSALERVAAEWPQLSGVAEAFRIGADVPEAFRAAAGRPGARDLRIVAASWQVAHRTGAGLGDAVDRVTHDLRAARATRRIVDGELASARATARLLAGLPVLALVMGSGTGGDPWGFLFGHPIGLACLASGLAFGGAGLWWIEVIARDVDRAS